MRILFLIITIFLVSQAEGQEDYITFGASGVASCGTYVDNRRADDSLDAGLASIWLTGYMTRFARDNRVDTVELDIPSMMLWIENYCLENAHRNFAYAAARLTVYLQEEELVTYVN